MRKLLVLAVAMLTGALATGARAADKPQYAPPAAWVKAVPIPAKSDAGGAATQLLLQNVQKRFSSDGDATFVETAVKIATAQGLDHVGNVILSWRPDSETLTIHRLQILRDGKATDLLDGGKAVTILRRETSLELSTLDGALTATVQPSGLQVGDVIDLAYTMVRKDPVLKGNSQDLMALARPGVIGRAYFRASWPASKPVRWRVSPGMPEQPKVQTTPDGQEFVLDMADIQAPHAPVRAPLRFANLAQMEFSQFAGWQDISALMAPLYAKAEVLRPNSPLKAEIDRIAAASTDPKSRALAALKLVEDRVRYVALLLDNGGYAPAEADATWQRLYGDCKGKTVLLLSLLKGLGVDAEPVLVNTRVGDGMDEHLPLLLFDHVLVRARINGKSYWLDGTRGGDTTLDGLPTPNYHWGLPVRSPGAALERVQPAPYDLPHFEQLVHIDATAGMDAPAPAHVEYRLRGDEGMALRLKLQTLTKTDIDIALRGFFRQTLTWIEPQKTAYAYDEAQGVLTMTMDGQAKMDWAADSGGARSFVVEASRLGYQVNLNREDGPGKDAPYVNVFPFFEKHTVEVQLPSKGQGFFLANNGTVNRVIAGMQMSRETRVENGVATIVTSQRSIAPEFPASEAQDDATGLRQLADFPVIVRFANLKTQADLDRSGCLQAADNAACTALIDSKPETALLASAYAARGLSYMRQKDYDAAVKDYGEAVKLNPKDAGFAFNLGVAEGARTNWPAEVDAETQAIALKTDYAEAYNARGYAQQMQNKFDAATTDYDQALRLNPDYVQALINRGILLGQKRDFDGAIADNSQVIKLQPGNADAFNNRAMNYRTKGDLDHALADFDQAIRLRPGFTGALAGRAVTLAAKGQYDAAFQDLDVAFHDSPDTWNAHAARAVIYEMRKDYDKALEQLDSAIKLKPDNAGLYGARSAVLEKLGRLDDELRDDEKVAELTPPSPPLMNNRCWRRAVINRELDKALELCDEAVRLAPREPAFLDSRALVYFREGQYDKAKADEDKAIDLGPKAAPFYFLRGLAERKLGESAAAEADLAAAKTIDPKIAEAYAPMGLAP